MTAPIRRVELTAFQLPLRRSWRFGGHELWERSGWLIRLIDADGHNGWGEATPLPQIGTESPEHSLPWLRRALDAAQGQTPALALAGLNGHGAATPAARCGLECALLDLQARQRQLPLARLLHPAAALEVGVHAALGDLRDVTADTLKAIAAAGYRRAKLKLGCAPTAVDKARLQTLTADLPDGLRLRLDANQAWSAAEARSVLTALDPAQVELVEEPLRADALGDWPDLQGHCRVALALDESLDPAALDAMPAARVLILKPMRLGGLLPCLEIARRAGRDCLVTTSLDGAVAGAAAAHLAAALDAGAAAAGFPAQFHGLATAHLLARDLAPALAPERGRLRLPEVPGLGLAPQAPALEER